MAVSAACGTLNVTTAAATNTVVVSGLGFQPKVVLFFWTGRTGIGFGRNSKMAGFGAVTSTTSRFAVASVSADASAAASAFKGHTDAACILALDASGVTSGLMDLQSFDADGFTLVIDDAFPANYLVQYLALGGTSITNATTGWFTAAGTAPVTQAITGVGFQPTTVLFASAAIAGNPPGDAVADSGLMLGAMTGASDEHVSYGGSNSSATTMATAGYTFAGECIASPTFAPATLTIRGEFSAFGSDGFTVNWLERGPSTRIFYLALAGADVVVGDFLTETSLTTIAESGFGFKPAAVMVVSQGKAQNTQDTTSAHDRWSIGFSTSPTSRAIMATLDRDATADSEVSLYANNGRVYNNLGTGGVSVGDLDVQSFDSDGLTFEMKDADPSQAFVWYVAFGPAAAAVGNRRRRVLLGAA